MQEDHRPEAREVDESRRGLLPIEAVERARELGGHVGADRPREPSRGENAAEMGRGDQLGVVALHRQVSLWEGGGAARALLQEVLREIQEAGESPLPVVGVRGGAVAPHGEGDDGLALAGMDQHRRPETPVGPRERLQDAVLVDRGELPEHAGLQVKAHEAGVHHRR